HPPLDVRQAHPSRGDPRRRGADDRSHAGDSLQALPPPLGRRPPGLLRRLVPPPQLPAGPGVPHRPGAGGLPSHGEGVQSDAERRGSAGVPRRGAAGLGWLAATAEASPITAEGSPTTAEASATAGGPSPATGEASVATGEASAMTSGPPPTTGEPPAMTAEPSPTGGEPSPMTGEASATAGEASAMTAAG